MKTLKKISLLLVFVLCFNQCSDDSIETTPKPLVSKLKATTATFTVLSYNVAGLLEIFSSATNREYCSGIIGSKINAYDIVNMQEDFNYHAYIYATNTHPYRTATSGGMGIGDGLNTVSKYPFSDDLIRVKWNSCNGTDCLTPKGFTWIRIRLAEGVYLDVYNLHTNAGSTSSDYAARQANINQIVSYINTNSAGNAVLIFGDTNCRYTRSEDNIRNILTGVGTLDSWVQLIKGGTPPALGSPTLGCDDTSVILTEFSCEVVDKIFYRGNKFITLTPLVYTLEDADFRYGNGYILSDHRPVYTKFQYTLSDIIKMSDQFGGPHGTSYNDVNSLPSNPSVTKIGIRTGSRVDQVNLTLSNGTSFNHGGSGGTAKSLTLNSGEYVKSVYMCSGQKDGHTRVFYIKFTTSSGRTLSGGTTTGSSVTYTAPSGWKIVGFHGRAGSELDKMGVIYAPI
jgi:endonuclease/exonuclease/phosphatase family metal-dependent hydrolase